MAKQSSTVWILGLLFVLLAGAAAVLFIRGDADITDGENKSLVTQDAQIGVESGSEIAAGEASGATPGEAGRTNAGVAADEVVPSEVGETVLVRGKLIVEETGTPPKNATVGIRTGKDELDFAWMVARVGGRVAYDRLQRTGELELKFLESGGWKPTFRTQARADGSFELRVPKKAVRFTFDVVADFASYSNQEWIFLSQNTIEKGVTVMLNEAGAVEGKLVNESGQPVPGAYIMANVNRSWDPGRPSLESTQLTNTDKDGKFTFRGLNPGTLNLTALAEKYGIATESNVVVEAGKTANVEIKLAPEVPLEGLVVDAQGQGVADVFIRIYPERRSYQRSVVGFAKSDTQGRVRWKSLVAGTYKTYGSPEFRRMVESPESIVLPLAAGAQPPKWVVETGHFVAGKVVTADGKPAAGAKISATTWVAEGVPAPDKKKMGSQRGICAADGTFRLAGLPEGPFVVAAMLENVSSSKKTDVQHDTTDVEIKLLPQTGIAGSAIDASTGTGIKIFVLSVVTQRDADRMGSRMWGWGSSFDRPQITETGEFEVGGLEADTYVIHASAEGYIDFDLKEIIVKSGEMTRGVSLKLVPGATIAGKVIDAENGKPVVGAQVEFIDSDEDDDGMRMPGLRVRGDGKFELRGRKAGRGKIVAFHDKYIEASSDVIELQAGQRVEIPSILLGHGGAVEGVAIGRDAAVLPRAQISAYYSERTGSAKRPRHAWRNVPAEKDGSFRLEGLQAGEWTVTSQPPVKDNNWQEAQNKQVSGKVTVVEGQTSTVVFSPPKQGGCTLRGRVTRGGKPVANGNVSLWRRQAREDEQEGTDNQNYSATLGSNGDYEIEHVTPGKVGIHVSTWGDSNASYSAEFEIPNVTEHRYDIDMPLGGEIKGRITRKSDGKALAGISVHAYSHGSDGRGSTQSNTTTSSDGRYSLGGLATGKVTVQAEPDRWGAGSKSEVAKYTSRAQEAAIVEGTVATLDFVLEEGTSVIVEVLGPDGKPISGAWVNIEAVTPGASALGPGGYGNTNELGIAKIQGVTPGRVKASAQVEKYPSATSEEFEAVMGSEARTQIRLLQGVEVTLRLSGSDGATLKPEAVSLQRADGSWAGSAYYGNSGQPKDGSLKITAMPGSYTAVFSLGKGEAVYLDVTIGQDSGAVINLNSDKNKAPKK